MTELAASVVWAMVAMYAVSRLGDAVERVATLFAPVRDVKRDDSPAVVVLPADIEARAAQESEGWAQDEVRKVAREQYAAMRDSDLDDAARWNMVRSAIGIGRL